MRVQNIEPVIVVNMTKKKHKQQQQLDIDGPNNTGSFEEQDESSNLPAPKHCVHINKSVNVSTVQKSLKKISLNQCSGCEGSDAKNNSNLNPAEHHDVYICLQCAYQGCDRSSPEHHALNHHQTAHSIPHDVAVNLSSFAVWCYACDEFVASDVSRKLKDCIELLQRNISTGKKIHQQPVLSSLSASSQGADLERVSDKEGKQHTLSASAKLVHPVCSKVKGLANLGNTCFFNAVLQNLCQTHLLDHELREWTKIGQSVELIACSNQDRDADYSSDDDVVNHNKMDCLTVRLSECGPLTLSVLGLFDEVTSCGTNKQRNYVSPTALFHQVCQRAPRFKGFQQQDSHELLRYLLDGMKTEEIKRAQTAILKAFSSSDCQSVKDLQEDKKLKIKEFGRSAKHTFVDRIFGGVFISTVVCQACSVPTQIFEPFLDISLPIADDKSAANTSKSLTDTVIASVPLHPDATDDKTTVEKASKNQLKRQQKQARKQKKKGPQKLSWGLSRPQAEADGVTVSTDSAAQSVDSAAIEADVSVGLSHSETNGGRLQVTTASGDDDDDDDRSEDIDSELCGVHEADDAKIVNSLINGKSAESVDAVIERLDKISMVSTNQESKNVSFDGNSNGDVMKLRANENGAEEMSACCDSSDRLSAVNGDVSAPCDETRGDECAEALTNAALDSNVSSVSGSHHTRPAITSVVDASGDKANTTFVVDDDNSVSLAGSMLNGDVSVTLADDQSSECNKSGSMLNGDVSVTLADNQSSECNKSGSKCSFPTEERYNDNSPDRNRRSVKLEHRYRAMLAAMETAGARQKPSGKECSLNWCLSQFTAVETLSGNNMLACSTCNKNVKLKANEATPVDGATNGQKVAPVLSCANKQLLIYMPPAVLTLHLKRFQQVGFNLRKNTQHVVFTELFDLAPYCSAFCENAERSSTGNTLILYSLYGVIEHSGTLRSGHYTAYVKVRQSNADSRKFLQTLSSSHVTVNHLINRMHSLGMEESMAGPPQSAASVPDEGRWFHVSDTSVSEVKNIDNVLNCQAYILFYERVV